MQKRASDVTHRLETGDDLVLAVEQLVRFVRSRSTAGDLSSSASSALSRLVREGPQSITALAHAEHASQPNMTQLVTRLEKSGLVRRAPDSTDGRRVLVETTDLGRDVIGQRRAQRSEALQELLDQMSEAERDAVQVALPALAQAIRDSSR
ncbi:MarR family transcriptional regulator [Rhodococcus artemisiae]|uniref:MarR family transcriptional regulator n=1 Tax=Rhodococcus artemisiae TaxID=714159 RepID=A0ABU7LGI8_9NOCA|nr:MarR family transcriptional regulator [Rhodococcus artemisiae]MEE2060374.1 MarR family transcriptional regulator [Rhodococcus artemisiae]